jgi:phosphoribosylformylglycinamidine cyclo-ligase
MTIPITQAKRTYQGAGVDIAAGDALVEHIKIDAKRTHRQGVLGGIGGFGGFFELPWQDYREPVLVSGTDGVGSKLLIAKQAKCFDTIGIDLVAMCANDVLVSGSEPLFFLDYYATGKLRVEEAASVITGIAEGCKQANIALIGGETAELPGMYQDGDYDLAGFCVGIVEKAKIIDGSAVNSSDVLIALESSGPHSNGYSLIRQILSDHTIQLSDQTPFAKNKTFAEVLLAPTRIYVKTILALLKQFPIHAMAHITGGGLTDNIPRVLPDNCCAEINLNSFTKPPVFQWIAEAGGIEHTEMLRTFNCGVGMVLVIPKDHVKPCLETLHSLGEKAWILGEITVRSPAADAVCYLS